MTGLQGMLAGSSASRQGSPYKGKIYTRFNLYLILYVCSGQDVTTKYRIWCISRGKPKPLNDVGNHFPSTTLQIQDC